MKQAVVLHVPPPRRLACVACHHQASGFFLQARCEDFRCISFLSHFREEELHIVSVHAHFKQKQPTVGLAMFNRAKPKERFSCTQYIV